MKTINIGYGNVANTDHIEAVVSPESAPIKRVIKSAEESGNLIDATYGKRTCSAIIMDSGKIILSTVSSETLGKRMNE